MKTSGKTLRNPLGHARGIGAAKEGVAHWWSMQISSRALVFLSLWLMISAVGLAGVDGAGLRTWVATPLNSMLMLLFIGFTLHHSAGGIQVVIEDYVSCPVAKMISVILNTLLHIVCAVVAFYSILMIAVKG